MSREIKFRAWDGKRFVGKPQDMLLVGDGGIVTVDYRPHPSGTWEPHEVKMLTWNEVKNLKVSHYTGLKDKNGVEIYEGDIVAGSGLGVVEYSLEHLNCGFVINRGRFEKGVVDMPLHIPSDKVIEVIGNIYENPELLKQEAA